MGRCETAPVVLGDSSWCGKMGSSLFPTSSRSTRNGPGSLGLPGVEGCDREALRSLSHGLDARVVTCNAVDITAAPGRRACDSALPYFLAAGNF